MPSTTDDQNVSYNSWITYQSVPLPSAQSSSPLPTKGGTTSKNKTLTDTAISKSNSAYTNTSYTEEVVSALADTLGFNTATHFTSTVTTNEVATT